MILGGDEFARTQQGNNNAYCQDNEISWFDWTAAERNQDLVEFFRKAIALTRRFPVLQRRKFFLGKDLDDDGVPDLTWYSPDLGSPAWQDPNARTLCVQLDASEDGSDVGVDRLFFIFNGSLRAAVDQAAAAQRRPRRGTARSTRACRAARTSSIRGRRSGSIPPDHYLANPRSTVVLFAQQPAAVKAARPAQPKADAIAEE